MIDFDKLLDLDRRGDHCAMLDNLFAVVDKMKWDGKFDELSAQLEAADLGSMSDQLIVGILSATHTGHSKIASREAFIERAIAELTGRGMSRSDVADLMYGFWKRDKP